MSTSPIGTVFPAVAPSALVKVGIPTGDGFSMLDGLVPVESLTGGVRRFDVTFPASEFRNIAPTPLVIVESNRTVIITAANAILSEQTEEFDFDVAIGLVTGNAFPQLVEVSYAGVSSYFNALNGTFGFVPAIQAETLGAGSAYIVSKGSDATTGDGFVRITGLYYEIDL